MSLTLQMTPGNDNLAVWCIKLKSEGVNQIPNGAFDDATGWTQTGDWNITGGEATYTYSANASGDLTITVAAVSAVAYVLEYEVTTVTQDGFTLSLEGTGSFVSTVEVFLPMTLGQHRIDIPGKASSTTFRLKARTFGAGDVLKIDNVKFREKEVITYLATETLSLDNTWDGEVLNVDDRNSDIDAFIDVESSGSIGGVSAYHFTISRYSSNTRFDGFHEEFTPAFDGGNLSSMECQVGLVWNTASTDTEITWLMMGRVIDYQHGTKMTIACLQSTEIDSRPLPHYTVQKDFDNEVSYFTNAPDDNYGIILPIVYGDFSLTLEAAAPFPPMGLIHPLLYPLVLVDKHKLTYIAATHEFNTAGLEPGGGGSSQVWRYLSGLSHYMLLNCANGSQTNNDISFSVSHFDTLDSSDNVILGTIFLIPTLPGSKNDISNYSNLTNYDSGVDEITITSLDEVALMIDGTEPNIGLLSRAASSITIGVWQSDSVAADASDDTIITYFNSAFNSGVGGYGDETATAQFGWNTGPTVRHTQDISDEFIGRDINDEAWGWDEIFNLQYVIRSMNGYTNKYQMLWITIQNIVVTDARKTIRINRSKR